MASFQLIVLVCVLFDVVCFEVQAAGTQEGGIKFELKGTTYQNNSLVVLEDIGEGDDALHCMTDLRNCCRRPYTRGNWFFPNGTRVPSTDNQWDFHRTRGNMTVLLHRRRGGAEGIYRCEIPDAMNVAQTLYIGVYSAVEKLRVVPLQFELTSELNATTPTFTLTCTSTGGPATTVCWTVNNRTVTEDSDHHITSWILIYPEKATYNHTLAVTGRLEGHYECRVSNNKSSATRSLTVVGVRPPTNLRLSADSDDPTQTTLSWTTSRNPGVTGYQIYYTALGSTFSRSLDVGAGKSKHSFHLQRGFVYNITMVTRSQYLPSTVSTLISATLATVRNVTVTTVNASALLVSWDALQDSHLSHYTIYYSTLLSKVARSEDRKKVVKKLKKVVPSTNTSDIVNIRELRAGVEHEIHVTASLKIEGKVYEGDKYKSKKTKLDEKLFQLQIGPVTPCTTWSNDHAEKIESYIHTEIVEAISGGCNCEFPVAFIRSGIFQCWNTPDVVTYRSVIVGMEHHNATELLRSLEEWVNSEPVLQVEKLGLWVSMKCPVQISSLSDPQCPSFRQASPGGSTTVTSEGPKTSNNELDEQQSFFN